MEDEKMFPAGPDINFREQGTEKAKAFESRKTRKEAGKH